MGPLNWLIFGLGLFFLGLKLVGENLRLLTGPRFRKIIKDSTHSPVVAAGIGAGAGALMQSATAVTFIMVSMVAGGFLTMYAAGLIVVWCNVGLTSLAFLSTFDIHPIAAFIVGGAGIVLGTIRVRIWQTIAGALLGLGLILLGLESMGEGAAPLKNAEWFRSALDFAAAAPWAAFLSGIGAAALLQSNTGAAMLVITFAGTGALSFNAAMLMIFGTNLGAIGLRLFLSSGLKGRQMRLVRLEDLFCVVSGVVMLLLYVVESAGVPLVGALAKSAAETVPTQLALVFLMSNFLPALVMTPTLRLWQGMLKRIWPNEAVEEPGKPLYIHSQALDDPASALDLLQKEIRRLLETIKVAKQAAHTGEDDEAPSPEFAGLSSAIEKFAAKLAARGPLDEALAVRLHTLRAELSVVRHVEDSVRPLNHRASHCADAFFAPLKAAVENLLALAGSALEDGSKAEELKTKAKLDSDFVRGALAAARQTSQPITTLDEEALTEDFTVVVWTLRRLAKILKRISAEEKGDLEA